MKSRDIEITLRWEPSLTTLSKENDLSIIDGVPTAPDGAVQNHI